MCIKNDWYPYCTKVPRTQLLHGCVLFIYMISWIHDPSQHYQCSNQCSNKVKGRPENIASESEPEMQDWEKWNAWWLWYADTTIWILLFIITVFKPKPNINSLRWASIKTEKDVDSEWCRVSRDVARMKRVSQYYSIPMYCKLIRCCWVLQCGQHHRSNLGGGGALQCTLHTVYTLYWVNTFNAGLTCLSLFWWGSLVRGIYKFSE